MPPLSSWTSTFPSTALLDTGVLYIGSGIWSAHDGGLECDLKTERRNMQFDGKRSDVALLDRNVGFDGFIRGPVMEISEALLKQYDGGATLVTVTGGPSGATQIAPKPAGTMYVAGDYLSNVRAVWQLAGGTYFQVRFPKSLVVMWTPITGRDKEEVKLNIEIRPRLDMSVSGQLTGNCPWVEEFFAAAP
jgi:hypothetical protein